MIAAPVVALSRALVERSGGIIVSTGNQTTARLRSAIMRDLWATDQKVLSALAEQTESEGRDFADIPSISEQLGLDNEQINKVLRRLHGAGMFDGRVMLGGDWVVSAVTERGLREVGAWPSPDQLTARLVAALDDAAEREPEPAKRSKLRRAATVLGEIGQKGLTEIIASYAAKMSGAA